MRTRGLHAFQGAVRQNDELSTLYGIEGFPTVLDANGKELARTGYRQGGSKAYVEYLKQLIAGMKMGVGTPSSTNAAPATTGHDGR